MATGRVKKNGKWITSAKVPAGWKSPRMKAKDAAAKKVGPGVGTEHLRPSKKKTPAKKAAKKGPTGMAYRV